MKAARAKDAAAHTLACVYADQGRVAEARRVLLQMLADQPTVDPLPWAICQISLARTYHARLEMTGRDSGERAKAAMAYEAALEVFAERGMASVAGIALSGLSSLAAL